MSKTKNTEPRQLKELRNLMPWTWDTRLDEHPPGDAAMRDFQECFSWVGSRGPSRRAHKSPRENRQPQQNKRKQEDNPCKSGTAKRQRVCHSQSYLHEGVSDRIDAAETPLVDTMSEQKALSDARPLMSTSIASATTPEPWLTTHPSLDQYSVPMGSHSAGPTACEVTPAGSSTFHLKAPLPCAPHGCRSVPAWQADTPAAQCRAAGPCLFTPPALRVPALVTPMAPKGPAMTNGCVLASGSGKSPRLTLVSTPRPPLKETPAQSNRQSAVGHLQAPPEWDPAEESPGIKSPDHHTNGSRTLQLKTKSLCPTMSNSCPPRASLAAVSASMQAQELRTPAAAEGKGRAAKESSGVPDSLCPTKFAGEPSTSGADSPGREPRAHPRQPGPCIWTAAPAEGPLGQGRDSTTAASQQPITPAGGTVSPISTFVAPPCSTDLGASAPCSTTTAGVRMGLPHAQSLVKPSPTLAFQETPAAGRRSPVHMTPVTADASAEPCCRQSPSLSTAGAASDGGQAGAAPRRHSPTPSPAPEQTPAPEHSPPAAQAWNHADGAREKLAELYKLASTSASRSTVQLGVDAAPLLISPLDCGRNPHHASQGREPPARVPRAPPPSPLLSTSPSPHSLPILDALPLVSPSMFSFNLPGKGVDTLTQTHGAALGNAPVSPCGFFSKLTSPGVDCATQTRKSTLRNASLSPGGVLAQPPRLFQPPVPRPQLAPVDSSHASRPSPPKSPVGHRPQCAAAPQLPADCQGGQGGDAIPSRTPCGVAGQAPKLPTQTSPRALRQHADDTNGLVASRHGQTARAVVTPPLSSCRADSHARGPVQRSDTDWGDKQAVVWAPKPRAGIQDQEDQRQAAPQTCTRSRTPGHRPIILRVTRQASGLKASCVTVSPPDKQAGATPALPPQGATGGDRRRQPARGFSLADAMHYLYPRIGDYNRGENESSGAFRRLRHSQPTALSEHFHRHFPDLEMSPEPPSHPPQPYGPDSFIVRASTLIKRVYPNMPCVPCRLPDDLKKVPQASLNPWS
eukprot:jgi/Botrbrau1/22901/Bobra.0065s0053.1